MKSTLVGGGVDEEEADMSATRKIFCLVCYQLNDQRKVVSKIRCYDEVAVESYVQQ